MSYNTGVCRSCMIGNIEMVNFSQTGLHENSTLSEIFSECTNLIIDINDELPKQICLNCEKDLKIAYHFKKRSEESDRMLRELHSIKDDRVCIKDIFIETNFKVDTSQDPSAADLQKICNSINNIKSSPDIKEASNSSGLAHEANGNFRHLY